MNRSVIETLIRDGRYALRLLRRSPGFTLTAVLTTCRRPSGQRRVFSLVTPCSCGRCRIHNRAACACGIVRMSSRGVFPRGAIDGAMWEAINAARYVGRQKPCIRMAR